MAKITEHIYVPKHTKLTKQEKADLLKKYNISIDELPRITKSDKAIAHLNIDNGDIVKIARKSHTAGESIYYRVVVTKVSDDELDIVPESKANDE